MVFGEFGIRPPFIRRRAKSEDAPRPLVSKSNSAALGNELRIRLTFRVVDRRRIPAGARPPDLVDDVNRDALAQKIIFPSFTAVRRRIVGFAGIARTMHHDDRPGAGFLNRWNRILDIHLIYDDSPRPVAAARIISLYHLAVNKKTSLILQRQRRRGKNTMACDEHKQP